MSRKKGKYLVIDTETTGLHAQRHGLIQVGAIILDKNLETLATFSQDVCPPIGTYEISDEATAVHGFSQERIDQGVEYPILCKKFLEFIRDNFDTQPIAVGHFYPFDYAFMDYVFSLERYSEIMNKDVLTNQFIDTKSLALALNLKAELEKKPIPFPVTSLSKPGGLKDTLQVAQDTKAHDALEDAIATAEVLKKLIRFLP